jgi:hypothetical protein
VELSNSGNTWAGTLGLSGVFYVGTVSGTVNYAPKDKTLSVVFSSTWDSVSSPTTINTTYEIVDENTIKVNAKDLLTKTVFKRSGSTYSATVNMLDGGKILSGRIIKSGR